VDVWDQFSLVHHDRNNNDKTIPPMKIEFYPMIRISLKNNMLMKNINNIIKPKNL
jgi:hypothetical protein